ncbi:MAG: hypothetical protein Q7S55_03905 [Nanoarchaeota archaeon]|nr:hypothetical protein [Nanoarchaeota archaeon]
MYRNNELGNVLREQHEEAKATLEEMAEERMNVNSDSSEKIGDALETMGFEKKELGQVIMRVILSSHRVQVYVRQKNDITEILFDDLSILGKSLYQIPAGQNVQEWYNSIPDLDEWKKKYYSRIGTMGLSTMMGGALIGSLLGYFIAGEAGALLGSVVLLSIVGGGALVYRGKKHPLYNQLIASGPDALRYIANNTEYEAPQLRIATKSRIIDAEFTDENAEAEQYQEQVRETLAIEETEKQEK